MLYLLFKNLVQYEYRRLYETVNANKYLHKLWSLQYFIASVILEFTDLIIAQYNQGEISRKHFVCLESHTIITQSIAQSWRDLEDVSKFKRYVTLQSK